VTESAEAYEAAGPSAAGSVVLDIGAGMGALVLFAPAHLDGVEIEISAAEDQTARRTHSRVRKRGVSAGSGGRPEDGPAGGAGGGPASGAGGRPASAAGGGPASYAAVYPELAAGTYTIWRGKQTSAGTVVIGGGQVTTWHWPATAEQDDRSPASD